MKYRHVLGSYSLAALVSPSSTELPTSTWTLANLVILFRIRAEGKWKPGKNNKARGAAKEKDTRHTCPVLFASLPRNINAEVAVFSGLKAEMTTTGVCLSPFHPKWQKVELSA